MYILLTVTEMSIENVFYQIICYTDTQHILLELTDLFDVLLQKLSVTYRARLDMKTFLIIVPYYSRNMNQEPYHSKHSSQI